MKLHTIILKLDSADAKVIYKEIRKRHWDEMPDSKGNLAGKVIAEAIRDLNEYRALFKLMERERNEQQTMHRGRATKVRHSNTERGWTVQQLLRCFRPGTKTSINDASPPRLALRIAKGTTPRKSRTKPEDK